MGEHANLLHLVDRQGTAEQGGESSGVRRGGEEEVSPCEFSKREVRFGASTGRPEVTKPPKGGAVSTLSLNVAAGWARPGVGPASTRTGTRLPKPSPAALPTRPEERTADGKVEGEVEGWREGERGGVRPGVGILQAGERGGTVAEQREATVERRDAKLVMQLGALREWLQVISQSL
ncbi:MAG: hypothetical protein SGPRY_009151 [Prymnesium sp.]